MTPSEGPQHYTLWHLKAMYERKPAGTILRVRVRHIDGFHIDGRVVDFDRALTVRADSGMLLENVLPEHVAHAEII